MGLRQLGQELDEPRNNADSRESEDQDPSLVLAELARTLAQHGGGNASADLALDLVLNEIVQQACLATTATGAAAGLMHDGELVVRATTGVNAPELGVRLSLQAGLSGACMQTGEVQLSEDTQTDSRVDPETCAELHIQSILAMPIVAANEVLGILEIFSNRAHAFGDRDEQTLQALARRIVNTLNSSVEIPQPPPVAEEAVFEQASANFAPAAEPERLPEQERPAEQLSRVSKRGFPTLVLILSIIGVALLLGWMIGRPPSEQTPKPVTSSVPAAEPVQSGGPAEAIPAEPRSSSDGRPIQKKAKPVEPPPANDLVVYDKGKVIFESAPQGRTEPAARSSIPTIPSAIAGGLVIAKIRPEYPEAAKQQQIEGPVKLEITVGEDGLVKDVKIANGDPLLAEAAVTAIRQWRFRSYAPGGIPGAFRTSVTVKFSLAGGDGELKNP